MFCILIGLGIFFIFFALVMFFILRKKTSTGIGEIGSFLGAVISAFALSLAIYNQKIQSEYLIMDKKKLEYELTKINPILSAYTKKVEWIDGGKFFIFKDEIFGLNSDDLYEKDLKSLNEDEKFERSLQRQIFKSNFRDKKLLLLDISLINSGLPLNGVKVYERLRLTKMGLIPIMVFDDGFLGRIDFKIIFSFDDIFKNKEKNYFDIKGFDSNGKEKTFTVLVRASDMFLERYKNRSEYFSEENFKNIIDEKIEHPSDYITYEFEEVVLEG